MPIVNTQLSSSSSSGESKSQEQLDGPSSSSSSSSSSQTPHSSTNTSHSTSTSTSSSSTMNSENKATILSGPSSLYHRSSKGIGNTVGGGVGSGVGMSYPSTNNNTWRKPMSYSVIVGKNLPSNHSISQKHLSSASTATTATTATAISTHNNTYANPNTSINRTIGNGQQQPQQPHRQINLRHKNTSDANPSNNNKNSQKERKKSKQLKSQSHRYNNNNNNNNNNANRSKSISPRSSNLYLTPIPTATTTNVTTSHPNDSNQQQQQQDEHLTTQLHSTLSNRGVYETQEGMQKRLQVLKELHSLLLGWSELLLIRSSQGSHNKAAVGADNSIGSIGSGNNSDVDLATTISTTTTPSSHIHQKYKLQLISFGSYRLGVNNPSADMDLLTLCPPHISRLDFFSSLVSILQSDERMDEIHPIPKAYTPVIKFEMRGISIDLLFVSLVDGSKLGFITQEEDGDGDGSNGIGSGEETSSTTPTLLQPQKEFELNDTMLMNLDEQSVRSLNGVRVAQFLCTQMIPNKDNFTLVLRTVKEWALVHGLYSNVLGFLGGINWAILVAWVCKRNVKASAPLLLKLFFQTFRKWDWPKPVKLNKIVMKPPQGVMPLPIWNPKSNPRDRAHLMPIITPVYPSMNSSYNVGEPQLRRIQEELYRGELTINEIANGNAQWSDLLKGNDFFREHGHYLQINIIASNNDDYRAWFGLCESRLRILIAGLESPQNGIQAYPFAKFFKRKSDRDTVSPILDDGSGNGDDDDDHHHDNYDSNDADGDGDGDGGVDTTSHIRHHMNEQVITTAFFIALRFANGVDSVDLKNCTEEFVYKVNNWEERKDGMDLSIQHRLQADLPSFVFDNEDALSTGMNSNELTDEEVQERSGIDIEEVDEINKEMDCPMSPLKKTKLNA